MTPKQTHYVYRLFSGYELLYVGCTSRPEQRLAEHRDTKTWWPEVTSWQFIGPLPKLDALTLETALHEIEQPRHSLSGKQVGQIAAAARARSLALNTA